MGSDINRLLSKTLIGRYLSERELDDFASISTLVEYEPNQVLIDQDVIESSLHIIVMGTVVVEVVKEDGCSYVCSLGEGEVIGEAGLFLNMPRTAQVRTPDGAQALKVERSDFFSFLKTHPSHGIKLLLVVIYGLLQKLKDTNRELAFERREDGGQGDIDALIGDLLPSEVKGVFD